VSTALLEAPTVEETTTADPAKCAHIVRTKPGQSAAGLVLEARISGFPIEALCGYTWVPSKNAEGMPVCPSCKEIYDLYRMFKNSLNESPAI
jgi:hypothetical protein